MKEGCPGYPTTMLPYANSLLQSAVNSPGKRNRLLRPRGAGSRGPGVNAEMGRNSLRS